MVVVKEELGVPGKRCQKHSLNVLWNDWHVNIACSGFDSQAGHCRSAMPRHAWPQPNFPENLKVEDASGLCVCVRWYSGSSQNLNTSLFFEPAIFAVTSTALTNAAVTLP